MVRQSLLYKLANFSSFLYRLHVLSQDEYLEIQAKIKNAGTSVEK